MNIISDGAHLLCKIHINMQAAIHAIRDFPHGPAEIHVVPEINNYSLDTVTIWSNNKTIVVNESVWKSSTMAM